MFVNVLRKIEAENAVEPVWIVGPKTGKLLYLLLRLWQPEVVLEIGASVAYSALWMAAALEENEKGTLYTIESHQSRFDRAVANIEESGLGHRICLLKGHAPEILQDATQYGYEAGVIPGRIDFAFFDATKKDHGRFFEEVYPRLSVGGLICVDNVLSHRFGEMEKFIARLKEDERLEVIEIPVGAGLLVALKKS